MSPTEDQTTSEPIEQTVAETPGPATDAPPELEVEEEGDEGDADPEPQPDHAPEPVTSGYAAAAPPPTTPYPGDQPAIPAHLATGVVSPEAYEAKHRTVPVVHVQTETGWEYRVAGDPASGPAAIQHEPDDVPPVGTLSQSISDEREVEDKARGEVAAAEAQKIMDEAQAEDARAKQDAKSVPRAK